VVPTTRTCSRSGAARSLGTLTASGVLAAFAVAVPLAAQNPPVNPPASQTRADSLRRDSTMRTTTAAGDTTRRSLAPNAVTPQVDPARGTDAEIRVALFELMNDRDVQALTRLRALERSGTVGVANMGAGGEAGAAAGTSALRGRDELRFLLAQSYYRLGMDSAFRAQATPLATSGRYASVLRGQLMLEAYRRGDYARARQLAQQLDGNEGKGLAQLVAGLADYQSGDHAGARTAFQAAQQSGAPYASYAKYMEALTLLRQDTTQTQQALAALEQAAQGSDPEFADQVRLTAAQLAYEGERWADAVRLAGQVRPQGGLAAQALLTRAWALYKSDDAAAAAEAFRSFASQYAQLPERDEAQLMAAQALLQTGRTDEAGQLFKQVADSMAAEMRSLSGRTGAAMTDAARALVQARVAGLLFIEDPAIGKSVALHEGAGAEGAVLVTVVRDTVATAVQASAPELVSLEDVTARLQSAGPGAQAAPRRVLFAPASATKNRAEYAARSAALYDADVAVALARWELGQELDARSRQLAMLQALNQLINEEESGFAAFERQLQQVRDSLARLASALDAARTSLTQMLQAQINTTRMLANENLAVLDSVRAGLMGGLAPQDDQLLAQEQQTARLYLETASLIEQGLSGAIDRHPTFALRDSVRMRGDRVGQLLASARGYVDTTRLAIQAELSRLQGNEGDRARVLRQTLAAAEGRRGTTEQALVAVVERELSARAGELLAGLRRDTEAAEFGQASTSFFQALDADRRAQGAQRAGSAEPPVAAATPAAPAANPQPRNK
jgi:outer membrane protein assembly factor BamD (BamD/ComL family)